MRGARAGIGFHQPDRGRPYQAYLAPSLDELLRQVELAKSGRRVLPPVCGLPRRASRILLAEASRVQRAICIIGFWRRSADLVLGFVLDEQVSRRS